MSRRAVNVTWVDADGPAARAGVQVGDRILAIDGDELLDSLDFELLASEPELELDLLRRGEVVEATIEREWGEGLGLVVSHRPRACRMRCRFCFVEQQPKGTRKSLCLKDDDLALSFQDGNFVTLSNFDEEDVERIEEMQLSPLYVSIHATDPEVRERLLRPRSRAGLDPLPLLQRIVEAGVMVHAQIVLVPGYNDGAALERTLSDLGALVPGIRSIAVVPVGLTRFQQDETLRPFLPEEAAAVLEQVEPWRARFRAAHDVPVVYPSDEWYLLAGEPIPPEEDYDGYPQEENGVGLVRQLLDELGELERLVEEGVEMPAEATPGRRIALVTGKLAAGPLAHVAERLSAVTGADVRVHVVQSAFWGPRVTVTGLLTGADLATGLADVEADLLVVPDIVRNDDGLFLDDRDAGWLQGQVDVPILFAPPTLGGLWETLGASVSAE